MPPQRKRKRDGAPGSASTGTDHVAVPTTSDEPTAKRQQTRRSLFVRSLPVTTDTETLIAHFSDHFPVKHGTAIVDPATKVCKGYGFVTFADAEDAQKALDEFDGSVLLGRKIKLGLAEPRHRDLDDTLPAELGGKRKSVNKPTGAAAEARKKREEEKQVQRPPKLIVRNLPWSVDDGDKLALLFRMYGKVKLAVVPKKKPGQSAGFGFVVLRGTKNAENALKGVNGKEVDGRTLAVDWAVEKSVWEEQQGEAQKEDEETAPKKEHSPEDADLDVDEEEFGLGEDEDDETGSIDVDDDDGDDWDDVDSIGEEEKDETLVNGKTKTDDFSTTLFVRNLPFSATDETLHEHFSQFGALRYARVVLDQATERPKGTAFVCFYNADDAKLCLKNAPRNTTAQAPLNPKQSHSVLQNEGADPTGTYTLDGRILQLSRAVDKSEATRLTEAGIAKRGDRDKDKRRLYLLSEGTISADSPLYHKLSPSEIAMREASAKQRKMLIQSNPSLHLSLTRLSIRNIPRSITSKDLKAMAREAVVGFASDVKASSRERLSKEEVSRGGEEMIVAEKQRKRKGVGIVKQAKIVFEGREGGKVDEKSGAGRSRGYGFIEYYTHRTALMGLRWLNGHAIGYQAQQKLKGKNSREDAEDRRKRLIVEFAIENAQVVHRRDERETKTRTNGDNTTDGKKQKPKAKGSKPAAGSKQTKKNKPAKTLNSSREEAKPTVTATAEETEKLARRQRIIAKKRASRRDKKKSA